MERIKLNLIPSGVAPVVHCSQYDKGRKFAIDLFEGDSVYTLTGTETLSVNVRKPDGHLVTEAVVNTSSTYVEVTTTEQMVAVSGTNYAKLKIVKGAVTIATLEFLMNVSRDPLENGDPSESFVHDLATQIASGVATEVASQYDSANVLFDTVPTMGHGVPYTVTSEGLAVQIFNRSDVLLNVMGGTLRGFGSATVYMQNGIARIDFNIKVSVNETVSNVGTWGINRDYFTALTGKTITPLEGGVVTYYNNEQIYASRVDFGGTFLVTGQFWKPARVYDDNGTKKVGGWNSNVFASGDRFIGTCFGTYS